MKSSSIIAVLLQSVVLCTSSAQSDEYLSGDWRGYRSKWADDGVQAMMTYTSDYFYVASGGISRNGAYLGNMDIVLNVDAEKLIGHKGGMYSLYVLGNHGKSPGQYAGDLQGLSNIDAPETVKLYEAWVDQRFLDDRASIRFGLYDLNSEFDSMDTASLFINSSFGIGPDYSQSGLNGPSIFPTTSLALRLVYAFSKRYYVQAAMLDGVPGDPTNQKGTHIRFDRGDGFLVATEIGYTSQNGTTRITPFTKIAFGSWYYTEYSDDLIDLDVNNAPIKQHNYGVYALSEMQLYREANDHEQGLNAFLRYGWGNAQVNQINYYFGAGINSTGLIPGRDQDQLGLAIAHAVNGKSYKQVAINTSEPLEDYETVVELSYKAQIFPWFSLQPDLQWILNPSMDPDLDNAIVIGVRTEVSL